MSATRLVARLPVPSGSCPSTLDWSWSVRHGSRPPHASPPPSPPCSRYDISSSYFDKGREAGNGDGTGRDMGSLKNGYGPGLERGGCHPLNTTGRNKTSLSTFPPTKAPLQQTPLSRCRCCEIVVDPSPPSSPPLPPPSPPPPALCHPRGHGAISSLLSSASVSAVPRPSNWSLARSRSRLGLLQEEKETPSSCLFAIVYLFVCVVLCVCLCT